MKFFYWLFLNLGLSTVHMIFLEIFCATSSCLREGRGPCGGRNRFGDRAVPRKGIGLTFPNRDVDRPQAISGNASELGDGTKRGWFSQLIASVVAPSGFGERRAWSNVTSE